MFVRKYSKFHANFTQLDQMSKLQCVDQFIVLNVYFYIEKKKKKLRKYVFSIGGSRTAATSKMERFVIIKSQRFVTKRSILDVAAVLDPPLLFNILMLDCDRCEGFLRRLTHCCSVFPFYFRMFSVGIKREHRAVTG